MANISEFNENVSEVQASCITGHLIIHRRNETIFDWLDGCRGNDSNGVRTGVGSVPRAEWDRREQDEDPRRLVGRQDRVQGGVTGTGAFITDSLGGEGFSDWIE